MGNSSGEVVKPKDSRGKYICIVSVDSLHLITYTFRSSLSSSLAVYFLKVHYKQ